MNQCQAIDQCHNAGDTERIYSRMKNLSIAGDRSTKSSRARVRCAMIEFALALLLILMLKTMETVHN
jgi:hypothetical protein